jgi:excisionase family DNA binding protein
MPKSQAPIYYTVSEVAEIVRVTEWTVREWLKSGTLKGSKPGRGWRVTEEDLHTFLNERHGA